MTVQPCIGWSLNGHRDLKQFCVSVVNTLFALLVGDNPEVVLTFSLFGFLLLCFAFLLEEERAIRGEQGRNHTTDSPDSIARPAHF